MNLNFLIFPTKKFDENTKRDEETILWIPVEERNEKSWFQVKDFH